MIVKRQFENQDERVEYDDIIYLINPDENTASVIGSKKNVQKVNIPMSINYKLKEYYIISIYVNAFEYSKIKNVEFSDDSKLQTIDKFAFLRSTIKSIRIPSSVTSIGEKAFSYCYQLEVIEIPDDSKLLAIDKGAFYSTAIMSIKIPSELIDLKEGWCSGAYDLTEISVSPKNPRYCFFDDKMIIGKKRIEESNYDCLVFCVRNIRQIKIPNFIEHICSYSLECCEQLENVEFSNDSKLQTIDGYAFSKSRITSFRIPSSVTSIGEGSFFYCKQLEVIEILDDSKLQTIDKNAFSDSKIKSIKIPSELIDLKEGWCNGTGDLTEISVSPKNPRYFCYEDKMIISKSRIEESNYDCLVFCVRNIRQIKIPNFIEHICSCSFNNCNQLENVEFSNDSKLQTIDKYAFSSSTIKSIRIPSSVTSIGENAFSWCRQLEVIEIPDDSKLQTIDKNAFSDSKIKSIQIPSSIISIGEFTFFCCNNLCIIEIDNTEMISMHQAAFEDCQNVLIMIPFHS